MQTSIRSFFKVRPTSTDPETRKAEPMSEQTNEKETEKRATDSPRTKRHANESDDETEIENCKRQAISTPEHSTTPVKSKANMDGDKVATPAKTLSQSPLVSVEVIVRKKISSGAYALHENIGPTWFTALQPEFDKPYFKKLSEFVRQQRQSDTVFPPPEHVFSWTHYHSIRDTRVVIIGQDPYHGFRQAHGLSFSVQKGVATPKSLQNIYKELASDIPGYKIPDHGNLTGWAKQGVLMLNACLTVNKGKPNSHQGKGWENFTDAVISWISKNVKHSVVFLLWGRFAQKKSILIASRHKILTSAHPSPFSADSGFFGCKHFSKTNAYLREQKLPEIDWSA